MADRRLAIENTARASRILELLGDFQKRMEFLISIRTSPSSEEYNEEGYVLLRRCVSEAQNLLTQPFQPQNGAHGSEEQKAQHLRRIIADAAVRRFKAQRLCLRAHAALRWVDARTAILQGQRAHVGHAVALQQIQHALRFEVAEITDQRVDMSMRAADTAEGKYLTDDPSLQFLQRMADNVLGTIYNTDSIELAYPETPLINAVHHPPTEHSSKVIALPRSLTAFFMRYRTVQGARTVAESFLEDDHEGLREFLCCFFGIVGWSTKSADATQQKTIDEHTMLQHWQALKMVDQQALGLLDSAFVDIGMLEGADIVELGTDNMYWTKFDGLQDGLNPDEHFGTA